MHMMTLFKSFKTCEKYVYTRIFRTFLMYEHSTKYASFPVDCHMVTLIIVIHCPVPHYISLHKFVPCVQYYVFPFLCSLRKCFPCWGFIHRRYPKDLTQSILFPMLSPLLNFPYRIYPIIPLW